MERDVRAAAAAAPLEPAVAAPPGRIVASPLARKLAEEYAVDLAQIAGTGPGGRITEKDVTAFVEARETAPPHAVMPPPPEQAPATLEEVAVVTAAFQPLNRVRRITAERMAASARSVARVTLLMEVDMTEAVRFRTQLAPEFERRYGSRLAYDAMIAKACAIGLGEHPHVNAQWQDASEGQQAGLRLQPNVNVGIAVAAEAGLLVVVVRDADKKSLWQVNADLMTMVGKSREGGLGAGRAFGRHVHDHEPGRLRRRGVHADRQPAGVGDPRDRADREAAGGGGRPGRPARPDVPEPVVRSPGGGRRAGGAVPPAGEGVPGGAVRLAGMKYPPPPAPPPRTGEGGLPPLPLGEGRGEGSN